MCASDNKTRWHKYKNVVRLVFIRLCLKFQSDIAPTSIFKTRTEDFFLFNLLKNDRKYRNRKVSFRDDWKCLWCISHKFFYKLKRKNFSKHLISLELCITRPKTTNNNNELFPHSQAVYLHVIDKLQSRSNQVPF